MSEEIKAALAASGLQAELRGRRAAILPVTAQVLDDVGAEALNEVAGRRVRPGDLMAFWSPDGDAGGEAVSPEDGAHLEFLTQLVDGSEMRFSAGDLARACADLMGASRDDAALRMEGVAARQGGADMPEAAQGGPSAAPESGFAEGALRGVPALLECVGQGLRATLDSPAASAPERSRALAAQHRIDSARLGAAPDDRGAEAQGQDGAAGRLAQAPGRDPAAESPQGDGVARAAADSVIADPEGFNEMQLRALEPIEPLTEEVFGALTSTEPWEIHVTQLSDADHERALRGIEDSAEAVWAEPARSRVAGILAERMPDYRFEARFFEHEGADIMLMRDHAGAYLYAWESDTRAVDCGPSAAPQADAQARLKADDPDPEPEADPDSDSDPDDSPGPA